jgi:hypothetical protein
MNFNTEFMQVGHRIETQRQQNNRIMDSTHKGIGVRAILIQK